jgi:carotenoid cleavage dioxygenase-like enzyme
LTWGPRQAILPDRRSTAMSAFTNRASYAHGPYAPVQDERTDLDLVVEGELPDALSGIFCQDAPNPRFAPIGHSHWFDGDGMVHAVHIEGGRASYRNRYVKTAKLQADEAAGQARKGGILMPFDPADPAPEPDTANTDLVFHNGKLLALWYLGGQPYALDPVTLDTLGPEDFGGKLDCGVAAHAKVCPATGELLFIDFGFRQQPWLRYGVVDKAGRLVHRLDIDLPQPTFMHDIGLTRNHTVFLDLPMTWDAGALARGRRRIAFHKDQPSRFGIVPRHGDKVQWFEGPSCYAYHTINCWEETDAAGNTVIVVTACRIEDPIPTTAHETEPDIPRLTFLRLQPMPWKWTFNLGTGKMTSEQVDDVPGEFPRMNNRFLGRRSRFGWVPRIARAPTLQFDALTRYDADGGPTRVHEYGQGRVAGESVFAPRADGTDEDDGWMLSFVQEPDGSASRVRVLDARSMDKLADIHLPRRVPFGFHTAWVPGESLNPAEAR